jgi:hypothetical protein
LILGRHGPGWLLNYRLSQDQLDTHVYVVGRTRQGKSKFLQSLTQQLIAQGQGCALIDPHADLADDLVAQLAPLLEDEDQASRIVYFDPARRDYLLPFNVLAAPLGPYAVAQDVLEAFRRTWPESLREAPRFANIILAATMVLITNHQTLVELPRLLTDPLYRARMLVHVHDHEVVRFFHTRYERWGREQALIAESVLNKVGALALNPTLRLILGQRDNALSFRRLMDEGKVLICNLGRADGETRRLLGSLIVTGLEQAALCRTDVTPKGRRPFFLILDEFQDYVAQEGSERTLSQMLSECRKFGLRVIMAHQHRGQLGPTIAGALENAGIKVLFGVGRSTARALAEEVFTPVVGQQTGQEHPPLHEQWESFCQLAQGLRPRQMLVQLSSGERVRRLRTCTVRDAPQSIAAREALCAALAQRSGRSVLAMRRALAARERRTQVNGYERI